MRRMGVVLETGVVSMGLNVFERRCVFLVASSQRQANKPGGRPITASSLFLRLIEVETTVKSSLSLAEKDGCC
jgi:hypothetical protein